MMERMIFAGHWCVSKTAADGGAEVGSLNACCRMNQEWRGKTQVGAVQKDGRW